MSEAQELPDVAPELDSQSITVDVVDTAAADQPTPDQEAPQTDYSFVPAKFLREGEPDWESMAKSYVNLEKRMGKKGATAPESPDEYVYEPKALEFDDQLSSQFKQEAHKMGISAEQYAWMMDKYETNIGQGVGGVWTKDNARSALSESWGGDYDTNMMFAKRAFDAYAPSDVNVDDIGNNPAVIKFLARVGMELQEDSTPANSTAASMPNWTRDDVIELMKTPEYKNQNSDTYKQVTAWYERQAKRK